MTLRADPKAAIAFLRAFRQDGPWTLTFIEPDGPITTKTFTEEDIDSGILQSRLAKAEGKENCYFTVNTTKQSLSKKPKKTDIEQAVALHVDVDPEKGKDRAEERARILSLLQSSNPPPTFLIDSGNGYQGFWKLSDPVDINGDDIKCRDFERYNIQLGLDLGGDKTHNIDRIMRLPGTINLPNKAKREKGCVPVLATLITIDSSRVYALAQFKKSQEVSPNKKQASNTKAIQAQSNARDRKKLEHLMNQPLSPVDLSILPNSIPEYAPSLP